MTPALLLATGLMTLTDIPAAPPTPTSTRSAYEAARDEAGRDAPAQVRLALWCEAHGLPAERLKHLALAALRDPNNDAARGLMGVVRHGDRWVRPDKLAGQLAADQAYQAKMAEYHDRRDHAGTSADAQAQLAQWCESQGLADEARAHHAMVLRLDPNRETSRRKLGYKKDGHRWVTDDQKAAEREEAKQQNEANRRWRASLTEWRGWLDDRGNRPARARVELAKVTDPRAVPSILDVFARGGVADQARAVQLLSQVDSPGSSRALVLLAVHAEGAEVRRAATEVLRRRDAREFAGVLIGMLRRPLKYTVTRSDAPDSTGTILIEGAKSNVVRDYSLPNLYKMQPGDRWIRDRNGLPALDRVTGGTPIGFLLGPNDPEFQMSREDVVSVKGARNAAMASYLKYGSSQMRIATDLYLDRVANDHSGMANFISPLDFADAVAANYPLAVLRDTMVGTVGLSGVRHSFFGSINDNAVIPVAQARMQVGHQFESDVAFLESAQRQIDQANAPVISLLGDVSGRGYDPEPDRWQQWYSDQLGFASQNPTQTPTSTEVVPVALVPDLAIDTFATVTGTIRRMSCFGVGTLVQTLDGPKAIERLRVGDRVLTARTQNGSLQYRPISAIHHNPPSPTFQVEVAGSTIVTSPNHRFWVAGKGWVMARDLTPGENLRILGSLAPINSIEPGPVQPVFNLSVDGDHNFFVGSAAALVHDNSLPDTRLVPFDSLPKADTLAASR